MKRLCEQMVVAVDFSPDSELAAKHAVRLARAVGGKIVLVHVVPEVSEDMAELMGKDFASKYGSAQLSEARKALSDFSDKTGCSALNAKLEVITGRIVKALDEFLERSGATLVCLGAHGTGETRERRLGTVAAHLLSNAPCSVLMVRRPHAEHFKKLLLALDLDVPAQPLLDYTRAVAAAEGAKIQALHVFEFPSVGVNVPGGLAEFEKNYRIVEERRVKRFLEEAAAQEFLKDVIVTDARNIPEGIVEQVGATDANLLVMGSRGRGRVAEFFMGSVSKEAARIAPCSILAIRANA